MGRYDERAMSATSRVEPASTTRRLPALDGLRGVAAFVVLVHHSFLLDPSFSATYGDGTQLPGRGSFIWLMSYTPLKLLTAGGEAVIVFFVLSGVVLTLPTIKRSTFDWLAYYPQRVARLGLPVLASISLAAVWILLLPQTPFQDAGTWLTTYSTPHPALGQFVSAINMFDGSAPYHVNNPLWSLSWEFVFSLALPAFLLLAIALKRWWIAGMVAIVLLTAIGRWSDSEALDFLPSFLVGALIAVKFDDLKDAAAKINSGRLRNLVWSVFLIIGALLLITQWLANPFLPGGSGIIPILNALSPLAAGMIVVACIGWNLLDLLLSTRLFSWAGKISFSLYLVHVPVLIFTAYLLRGLDLRLTIIVGIALSIGVGCGFYWLIEKRSHIVARRIGRRASESYRRFMEERRNEA
jgi:peptidoglycan/LPS O-acetylase OafA/YrhL